MRVHSRNYIHTEVDFLFDFFVILNRDGQLSILAFRRSLSVFLYRPFGNKETKTQIRFRRVSGTGLLIIENEKHTRRRSGRRNANNRRLFSGFGRCERKLSTGYCIGNHRSLNRYVPTNILEMFRGISSRSTVNIYFQQSANCPVNYAYINILYFHLIFRSFIFLAI